MVTYNFGKEMAAKPTNTVWRGSHACAKSESVSLSGKTLSVPLYSQLGFEQLIDLKELKL